MSVHLEQPFFFTAQNKNNEKSLKFRAKFSESSSTWVIKTTVNFIEYKIENLIFNYYINSPKSVTNMFNLCRDTIFYEFFEESKIVVSININYIDIEPIVFELKKVSQDYESIYREKLSLFGEKISTLESENKKLRMDLEYLENNEKKSRKLLERMKNPKFRDISLQIVWNPLWGNGWDISCYVQPHQNELIEYMEQFQNCGVLITEFLKRMRDKYPIYLLVNIGDKDKTNGSFITNCNFTFLEGEFKNWDYVGTEPPKAEKYTDNRIFSWFPRNTPYRANIYVARKKEE